MASAYKDLVDLYYESSAVRDSIRSAENRLLANLFMNKLIDETNRIFNLTDLRYSLI